MSQYNGPYQGPVGPVPRAERQRICEAVVGSVEWNPRENWGYCTCPGVNLHTNHNGRRDCRVYADETPGAGRAGGTLPPGVTCLHTSCRSAVEEASQRIRSLIGKAKAEAGRSLGIGKKGGTTVPRTVANPGGTFRAVEQARAGERASMAQPAPLRTGRTPVFRLPEGAASDFRTARTAISRPYALHAHTGAHTQAHAHVPAISQELPSEPSTQQPTPPATPGSAVVPVAKAAPEKPGMLTLCLNGEPPARVEWVGNTLKTKFVFKSRHE